MSYDTYLRVPLCSHCGNKETIDIGNYTYNVGPMFYKALSAAADKRFGFGDLDGLSSKDALPILNDAIAHMEDPEYHSAYIALNPANGWGSYGGALAYIKKLRDACQENPTGFIEIN